MLSTLAVLIRDFGKLHNNNENFKGEKFLAAHLSTGLDTSKSHENIRPWKFGAIQYCLH